MTKEAWTGRAGFILANLSAAVGLGSIWKFPYEVGSNGGGSFVLLYLIGLLTVVLPLMLAELVIGRRGHSDAVRSIIAVAREAGASASWGFIGWTGALTASLS